jgi:YVTN family beta-propeller protein
MKTHKIASISIFTLLTLIAFTVSAQEGVQSLAVVVNGLMDPERGVSPSLSIVNLDASDPKKAVDNEIILLGNAPNDIQVKGNLGYVVNTLSNNVQVIDLRRKISLGTIPIGDGTLPEKLGFVNRTKAYVTCNATNEVRVIELNTRQVVKAIPVGSAPWGVTVLNGKAYVTNTAAIFDPVTQQVNYGDSSVTVIDTQTDSVLTTIPVPLNTTDLVNDGESKILAQSTGDFTAMLGKLVIIDANSDVVEKTVNLRVIPGPTPVIDSRKRVFIGSFGGMLVYDLIRGRFIYDNNDLLTDFGQGFGMAGDSQDNVYVTRPDWTGGGQDELRVMAPDETLAKSYRVGKGASFVAIAQLQPSGTPQVDVNGDGRVDIFDLVLVGNSFGLTGAGIPSDVNGDGIVNIFDLVLVATRISV